MSQRSNTRSGIRSKLALFAFALGSLTFVLGGTAAAQCADTYTSCDPVSAEGVLNADGSATYTFVLPGDYAVGSTVTFTGADGSVVTQTVPADRTITLTEGEAFGNGTVTIAGLSAAGNTLSGSVFPNVVGGVQTVSVAVAAPPASGPISGTITDGSGPYTVTVTGPNGSFSTTVAAAGAFSIAIDAATFPAGTYAFTTTVVDANGQSASTSTTGTFAYGAPVIVDTATATPIPNQVLGQTVVPVATPDFGFGTNGVPNQPIAITGSNARVPVILGASLVGIGGLALLAARRRQNVTV